ncbi:MAG: hypothetical protein N4A47_01790 [Clostridia bacterium]|jgi:hypothetical protein|nr:hypothetical protein [Clostridia bacterium]
MTDIKYILSKDYVEKMKSEAEKELKTFKDTSVEKIIDEYDIDDEFAIKFLRDIKCIVSKFPSLKFAGTEMYYLNKEIVLEQMKGIYSVEKESVAHETLHGYMDYIEVSLGKRKPYSFEKNNMVEAAVELGASKLLSTDMQLVKYRPGVKFLRGLECITGYNISRDIIKNSLELDDIRVILSKKLGESIAEKATAVLGMGYNDSEKYMKESTKILVNMLKDKGIKDEEIEGKLDVLENTYFDKEQNFLTSKVLSKSEDGLTAVEDAEGKVVYYKSNSTKNIKLEINEGKIVDGDYLISFKDGDWCYYFKETGKQLTSTEVLEKQILEIKSKTDRYKISETLVEKYLENKDESDREYRNQLISILDTESAEALLNENIYKKIDTKLRGIKCEEVKVRKNVTDIAHQLTGYELMDDMEFADSLIYSEILSENEKVVDIIIKNARTLGMDTLSYMKYEEERVIKLLKNNITTEVCDKRERMKIENDRKQKEREELKPIIDNYWSPSGFVYRKILEVPILGKMLGFVSGKIMKNDKPLSVDEINEVERKYNESRLILSINKDAEVCMELMLEKLETTNVNLPQTAYNIEIEEEGRFMIEEEEKLFEDSLVS